MKKRTLTTLITITIALLTILALTMIPNHDPSRTITEADIKEYQAFINSDPKPWTGDNEKPDDEDI